MTDFFANILEESKGKEYINSVPIKEFSDISQLNEFVVLANEKGLGISLKNEKSNFYQGILVQIYDIKECTVKKYLN